MKQITIKILAQDIIETDYTICRDCAITRALKRAGLDLCETGGTIDAPNEEGYYNIPIMYTPGELDRKVRGMYKYHGMESSVDAIKSEDFEFTLEIPDYEERKKE